MPPSYGCFINIIPLFRKRGQHFPVLSSANFGFSLLIIKRVFMFGKTQTHTSSKSAVKSSEKEFVERHFSRWKSIVIVDFRSRFTIPSYKF